MKTTAVQVKFDFDKHNALIRYANKKEISIEAELVDTLEKLYKKLVPPDVREFIEESDTAEISSKESRKKKKVAAITKAEDAPNQENDSEDNF